MTNTSIIYFNCYCFYFQCKNSQYAKVFTCCMVAYWKLKQPFLQRTTFTVNTVKYCWSQKATARIICVQFGGMSQPMVFKVVNQCHSHVINLVLVFSVHAPLPLYLAVTVFMSSLCYPSLSLIFTVPVSLALATTLPYISIQVRVTPLFYSV